MNRILKIVYTMACLLTATGAWADGYKIRLNAPSNGTMTSSVAEASPGTTVTITVSPTGDYYLSALYYEKIVTDMGGAESPRRRSPGFSEETDSPGFSEKTDIPINTTDQTYRSNHYGGTYTISMPSYDIEVTAEFTSCTSITGATLHWDSNSSSINITYDHGEHTANVYLGSSDLTVDENYTITTNKQTDVGSITPTITGVGTYCGTINNQTISITQRPLTITAQPQTITYGSSIQTGISYVNVSGLVTNDALTGVTLTPSTSQVTAAGTITPSAATTTKGISNYAVTYNTGALTINPKDLSAMVTITLNEEYHNYDGSQHQPIFNNESTGTSIVNYGNTRLVEGLDFTCSYTTTPGIYTNGTDYIKPDIYTITVMFLGNYTGTKTVTYQIRPKLQLKNDEPYRWEAYYNTEAYNMKVPTGVQAWVVNGFNTTAVELTGKEVIKTQTPMLLFRAGSTKTFYPELTAETPTWTEGAYLKYNVSPWDLTHDNDIQDGTKKICILVRDNFVRTVSGTLAAGKCYLDLSGTTYFGAPLRLDITPTSIDTPEKTLNDLNNGKWYTLDGRQIQSVPTQKGIYIVNGKKIIIK